MLYKRLDRKRHSYQDDADGQSQERGGRRVKDRGWRFTALSFIVIALCLIFIKIANPEVPIQKQAMMLVIVGLSCVIMAYVARRMK
jgi:hypothetical protein